MTRSTAEVAFAQAALAHVMLLALAFLVSEGRRRINWRLVGAALVLEVVLAVLLLHAPPARLALAYANDAANALQRATEAGTGFVFGYLGGGRLPFTESAPGASYIIAFRALPMVLVISALSSLLFHWGVLQKITAGFAFVLRRSLGIGGPLALSTAVNVFVGMVEAPLLIRPYLARMSRGELFAVMAGGLAGVAGTVMVIYASFLAKIVPDAMGHILVVSVISMPAALAVAAVMVPFDAADGEVGALTVENPPADTMDAIVRGTMEGITPLAGIVAMLVVTVALVALVNSALGLLPHFGGEAISLQLLFAFVFQPVMWLIGVPWAESAVAAKLMATKTVLNEFVAYLDMAGPAGEGLSAKSRMILTYALCGFTNFGSLGIMVGGMGAMVPERRGEIVDLGMRAVLAGTLATCMCGALAGVLVS